MQGYEALRESCAWIDLTGRGVIKMTGEDRVRLLHAMCTNHIQQLQPGQGCSAFFLNAQGRILADANVLCFPDYLLLDTEPERRAFVYEHLDKYIIADDVTLEDLTESTAVIGVEGPSSAALLEAANAPAPEDAYSHAEWGPNTIARITATGQAGFRIFAPANAKQDVIVPLVRAGAAPADAEAARIVRLENGKTRYGEDITDKHLPHETQLLSAVHFNKGCYLGQEIVERVRSRGMVHRNLVPLAIASPEAPQPGAAILSDGSEAGEITSSAFSPALNKAVALGYLRAEFVNKPLTVNGAAVEVRALKPFGA